jgi:hypothetical protein
MSAEKFMQSLALAIDKMQVKVILQGTVTEVDGYDACTVEITPGLFLYDVRLNAVTGLNNNQVTVKPMAGSRVILAIIENVKTQAVVLEYGEVEEFLIKLGSCTVRVKDSKVKIESEGENVGELLSDFIAEVKKIVVIYGQGPNVAALESIAQKFNKIFD